MKNNVKQIFSLTPSSRAERSVSEDEAGEGNKNSIHPVWDERCCVRGATQVKPGLWYGNQPHSFRARTFSLCSSSITGAIRLGYFSLTIR